MRLLIFLLCACLARHLIALALSADRSSSKKRLKADAPERDLRSTPFSVTAKTPLRLPPGTHVVFGRLVNGTGNGDAQVMACMEGVVVRDGSDRLDDPGYDTVQLRYAVSDGGDDDEVWWEPTACVYEDRGSVEVSAAEYVLYCRRLRRRRCRRHCSSGWCCYDVYIYVCAFSFL